MATTALLPLYSPISNAESRYVVLEANIEGTHVANETSEYIEYLNVLSVGDRQTGSVFRCRLVFDDTIRGPKRSYGNAPCERTNPPYAVGKPAYMLAVKPATFTARVSEANGTPSFPGYHMALDEAATEINICVFSAVQPTKVSNWRCEGFPLPS